MAKGYGPVVVMQDQALHEVVAAGGCKALEAGEVAAGLKLTYRPIESQSPTN